jgi:glyoxylase-like metal-dependent hydrolase (beta-lactamase superfamily II)/ferredoxin
VAALDRRSPENAPGSLFVDASCIACDTCRRVAPGIYGGGPWDRAFVARQPASGPEWHRALMSLVSCPVAAIGTAEARPAGDASGSFPDPVDASDGVHDCGYAAESSFGAASWLVVRPGGNVLVDSPRFARPLLHGIQRLGGARYLFLSHRDDVADHRKWAEALSCERILHARDATRSTAGVERLVEGDAPVALAGDVLLVPVPGHTAGSIAVYLPGRRLLFAGDAATHVLGISAPSGPFGMFNEDARAVQESFRRLAALDFDVACFGHGKPLDRDASREFKIYAERRLPALARSGG